MRRVFVSVALVAAAAAAQQLEQSQSSWSFSACVPFHGGEDEIVSAADGREDGESVGDSVADVSLGFSVKFVSEFCDGSMVGRALCAIVGTRVFLLYML